MTYKELLEIIEFRIQNNVEPILTEEEAEEYLGESVVTQLYKIREYTTNGMYNLYTHGFTHDDGKKILSDGFHWESEIISKEEFVQETGIKYPESLLTGMKQNDEGLIENSIIIPEGKYDFMGQQDLSNRFLKGNISIAAFLTRFVAHYGNIPCANMLIAIIPECDKSYFSNRYEVIYNTNNGSIEFWKELINEPELFVGYLDIENKKIVYNPKFDSKKLVDTNSRAIGYDDQYDLPSEIYESKMRGH